MSCVGGCGPGLARDEWKEDWFILNAGFFCGGIAELFCYLRACLPCKKHRFMACIAVLQVFAGNLL